MVLDNDGISILSDVLKDKSKRIKREVLWVLSNVSAGTYEQVSSIVENIELMDLMMEIVRIEPKEVNE